MASRFIYITNPTENELGENRREMNKRKDSVMEGERRDREDDTDEIKKIDYGEEV